jgi:hypothetical protein
MKTLALSQLLDALLFRIAQIIAPCNSFDAGEVEFPGSSLKGATLASFMYRNR